MRIVKASTFTLASPVFVASDNETPTDCASTPTCTVTRADGTALAAATVTAAAGDGRYTAAITTTHTSRVDTLTIVWTGTVSGHTQVYTSEIEVVGGRYAQVPEMRAMKNLEDVGKFPAAAILDELENCEDIVERITGVAWVRRYCRESLQGDGTGRLMLRWYKPASVIAVTVDGVAQTVGEFSFDGRMLVWESKTFPCSADGAPNVIVDYEHGYQAPAPKLAREVKKWLRNELLAGRSDQPSDQIRQVFDGVTIQFSTPDPARGRPTGILTLDPVLTAPDIMHRVSGIA